MDQPEQLRLKRLSWAGPLTVAASVVAVLFIRMIAVVVLKPPATFQPLTVGPPIFDTVVAVTIAILVFIGNARYSLEPIRDFRALAAKVLVVSFVPDILLAMLHGFGGNWLEAFALMAMHVAVWAMCVTMLPVLTQRGAPDFKVSLPLSRNA